MLLNEFRNKMIRQKKNIGTGKEMNLKKMTEHARVAIKVTDMLGEEVLVAKGV
jgi:hypothetical protein